jgi:predicted GNAT family acetyltransferase
MKVVAHAGISEFWQAAGGLFTADPVRNTVVLTVLNRLLIGGRFSDAQPILLTVHDGDDPSGELVGATLCTPPFPLAVSALPIRAVGVVADHLVATGVRLSAVSGLRPEVEAFVAAWTARTNAEPTGQMDQRLYELGDLKPPTNVPGAPVEAGTADVELLADLRAAFVHEVGHFRLGGRDDLVRQVQDAMAAGTGQLVWRVDGRSVSMAAVSAPNSGMSRVAPVYTPPEFRGHGYGSAVTAAASQWALDKGAEHVLLFTDLANPVSNSIYQQIGYVPVADALDVRFT